MSTEFLSRRLQEPPAVVMGILNTTPDSFSDGGRFNILDSAVDHALSMVTNGAEIIDVGGESTRPGAKSVSVQEELDRVIPVIEKLSAITPCSISVDTYKPQVMEEALKAGAVLVNDVNGLQAEGAVEVVASYDAFACIMHKQGDPETMQNAPVYESVVDEVGYFLTRRVGEAQDKGIELAKLFVDPGIGFGKTLKHNLILLKRLPELVQLCGCHSLIGVSRKSLIDHQLGRSVEERLSASIGLAVQSVLNGAKIVRVHDVLETVDAIRMVEAVRDIE